ncbi:hypothetical protein [Streptomyces sp. cmx-4-25]|uniref:hypothetical protein n=1 Tax=unclassified Streptomyces TaxID=2593676 RepID=UPI00397E9A41
MVRGTGDDVLDNRFSTSFAEAKAGQPLVAVLDMQVHTVTKPELFADCTGSEAPAAAAMGTCDENGPRGRGRSGVGRSR